MGYYLAPDVSLIAHGDSYILLAPQHERIFQLSLDAKRDLDHAIEANEVLNPEIANLIGFLKSQRIIAEKPFPESRVSRDPYQFAPTEILLFPTSRCNLRCTYCYANGGETEYDLDLADAKIGIDYIIENALRVGKSGVVLKFHGGGEPFMNFDLMVKSVLYLREQASKAGLDSIAYSITNGLLNDRQRKWLVENLNLLTVSFDGPPPIQDNQRPLCNGEGSFERVFETIQFLESVGFPYSIRTTVANSDFSAMKSVYDFLVQHTSRKRIHFEPVDFCGRCRATGQPDVDANEFASNLLKLIRHGLEDGRSVYCAAYNSSPGHTYCGAAAGTNFAITTDGFVSACTQVTRRSDPLSEIFFFGKIDRDQKTVIIDYETLGRLQARNIFTLDACSGCYARYYCMGGCPVRAARVGGYEHVLDNTCIISKRLLDASIDMFVNDESTYRISFENLRIEINQRRAE